MPNSYPATSFASIDGVKVTNAYGTLYQQILPSGVYREDLGVLPVLEVSGTAYEVQGLTLTSYQNGAIFGHNTAGQNSLATTTGRVWLNYSAGTRTLIGSGIIDDGTTQLQVKGGILATGITLTTGAGAGKVLTSNATGVATWQTSSISSGTYTPTISNTTAITSWQAYGDGLGGFQPASWFRIGDIVTVDYPIAFKFPSPGSYATFRITLPVTTTLLTQTLALTGLLDAGNQAVTFGGSMYSGTQISASILLPSTLVPTSWYSAKFHIVYRVQ